MDSADVSNKRAGSQGMAAAGGRCDLGAAGLAGLVLDREAARFGLPGSEVFAASAPFCSPLSVASRDGSGRYPAPGLVRIRSDRERP